MITCDSMTINALSEVQQLREKIAAEEQLFECIHTISAEPDNEKAILRLMSILVRYYDADRGYIFEVDREAYMTRETYEWFDEEKGCSLGPLEDLPLNKLDSWWKVLQENDVFQVKDINDSPYVNEIEREFFGNQGVHSFIVIGIKDEEREVAGLMGLENPKANLESELLLQSAAAFIMSQISLRKAHEKIRNDNELLIKKILEASEANKAKAAFISAVSHEIRTPMNVIVGMTDIICRDFPDMPEAMRSYLDNIKRSGQNLLAIINDILDVSKFDSGKMDIVAEEYDTVPFFEDMALMFMSRIGKKPVDLIFDIDPKLPRRLFGDTVRLRQIIVNLMNNAIKFTDSGFVLLSVKIKNKDAETGDIVLSIEVKDSGIGIRKEDIGKLFKEFSQVDSVENHHKEGTGLGLALSRRLAIAMGGDITLESVYGEGSTFTAVIPQGVRDDSPIVRLNSNEPVTVCTMQDSNIRVEYAEKMFRDMGLTVVTSKAVLKREVIPKYIFIERNLFNKIKNKVRWERWQNTIICILYNPTTGIYNETEFKSLPQPLFCAKVASILNNEEVADSSQEENQLNFTAPEARILLVDDNEMNRVVAKGLLAPLNMQIDEAENGQIACDMVKEKDYHIVLMDHMMPVMDGIEATRNIRIMGLIDKKYFDLPIIALSANVLPAARDAFMAVGMNAIAIKPIVTDDLIRLIRQYLPAELIKSGDIEQPEAETQDISQELDKLRKQLPLLDIDSAVKNTGGFEEFKGILSLFGKKISSKIDEIKGYWNSDDINALRIEVHALKNNARIIGYPELGEKFYELEKAADDKNIDYIKVHLNNVLDEMASLESPIREYFEVKKDAEEMPAKQIAELLTALRDHMEEFEQDEADAIMEHLLKVKLPMKEAEKKPDLNEQIDRLSVAVADVDFDLVIEMTECLLADLAKL